MERSKVFISWSGERSRLVAQALGAWLEDVLQGVETFMSDTDIAAGNVWFEEIGDNIEASRFAVICVTPGNLRSTWLHFEAGAIGMSRAEGGARSSVVPYLVGLDTTDLAPPLSLFQAVQSDKEGTWRLVSSINARLPVPVDTSRLDRTFDRWWHALEERLAAIPAEGVEEESDGAERPERELLEEVLSLLRTQTRKARIPPPAAAALPSRRRLKGGEMVGSGRTEPFDRVGYEVIEQLAEAAGGVDPQTMTVRVFEDHAEVAFFGSDPQLPRQIAERKMANLLHEVLSTETVTFSYEPF